MHHAFLRSALLVLYGLLLATAPVAHAYRRMSYGDVPLVRSDSSNISFSVAPSVQGGLKNSGGQLIITPESDPVAALQAALNTWSSVPMSKARFAPLWIGNRSLRGGDSLNVFSFQDSEDARSLVGSAIAITNTAFTASGRIIDSDIVFNPSMVFSTTPTLNAFDIQAIATHELGHALGADHSPLESATMYPYSSPEETAERWLSGDDIAFVSDAYPAATPSLAGAISVKLSHAAGGAPVADAQVIAVDAANGAVVDAEPVSEGAYRIGGLPPGSYLVYAEPVDTAAQPAWQPAFFGGNKSPATVAVSAGATSPADFAVEKAGPVTFDFLDFSVAAEGGGFLWDVLPSGMPVELFLLGKGFDETIRPDDLLLLGPGLALRPESLQVSTFGDAEKTATLTAVFDIAPRQNWTTAVIAVRAQGTLIVQSGLRVRPAGPWFTPSGTVNAASYLPGGVAPGEIVSIFGVGMGPLSGIAAEGLDPLTGRLSPALSGVTVKFDGVPAPLFYVSTGQINCQAPFEIAGRTATAVEVQYMGLAGKAILPVAPASPAIFFGAVVNRDGKLNSSSDPIAREDVIVAYGTGQGLIEPSLATGQPAPLTPLSQAGTYAATVDQKPAEVLFAGMTPGFVGLLQVNVRIPKDAVPGDSVPLVISINDIPGPSYDIAVK